MDTRGCRRAHVELLAVEREMHGQRAAVDICISKQCEPAHPLAPRGITAVCRKSEPPARLRPVVGHVVTAGLHTAHQGRAVEAHMEAILEPRHPLPHCAPRARPALRTCACCYDSKTVPPGSHLTAL